MNDTCTLGEVEAKFADLIWENEPLSSGELVKKAEKTLKPPVPHHSRPSSK